MREKKLKFISGAIVALVVVGIVLGLYVANIRSSRFAADRAREVLTDNASEQLATLSAILDGQLSALRLLADGMSSHGYNSSERIDELMRIAKKDLSCGLVFLADSSGEAISGSMTGGDYSDRGYVQKALSGEVGMEFIETRATGRPGVALSVPCELSGDAGALCGVFFADSLSKLMSSKAYGGDSFSFVMTSSARLIAGGSGTDDKKDDDILERLFGGNESGKNAKALAEFSQSLSERKQATLDYKNGDERFMAVCIPFESSVLPENDWMLVNVATGEELTPEIAASRSNAVEAMLVFVVFSLLSLALFLFLRHAVERRLNVDNERMNRLISDMPGGFLRLELLPDGGVRPVFFNDNFCSLMGMTRKQVESVGKTDLMSSIHPQDLAYVRAGVAKLLASGEPQNGRYRLLIGTGAYRWFTVYGGVTRGLGDGGYLNLYYTDATDQIEARERYRRVVTGRELGLDNELGSCHLNITQNRADGCESSIPEIRDFARDGRLDSFVSAVFNKIPVVDDQHAFFSCFSREALQESFSSGKNHVQLEHRVVIGGEHFWIKSAADMLKNPDTGDLEAVIYARDVNDAHKLRQLITMVVDADYDFVIVITVGTGDYKTFVRSGGTTTIFKNTGKYEETLKSTADLVHPDDRAETLRTLQLKNIVKTLRAQGHSEKSYRVIENGAVRYKKMTHVWLDDTHRDIIAFRSDVTHLLEVQERQKEQLTDALSIAEQANAAKTDFLSAMSHDIRTPMNAIVGMAELAIEDFDNPAQIRESLQIIKDSSAHLLALINDILDMSRIESGKMVLAAEPFSHKQLFGGMADMYRAVAESKGLGFDSEFSVIHDSCIGDQQRIHRIVDNLVGNAIKFTPAGGFVRMSVRELPSEKHGIGIYEFVVSDTGLGMSEQTIKRMYEPFYRSDSSRANSIEGSGLGLPIVKRIVDLIGGSIDVSSVQGKGTTFTVHITLKLSEQPEVEMQATTEFFRDKDLGGMRILVCEDNEVNQLVALRVLEKFGAFVTLAENGLQGLELFTHNPPGYFDVVLMDIQMPIMNGYEAATAFRDSGKEDAATIPIIAMTANAFVEDIHKSFEAGMNAHLTKPIEPDKLFDTLRSIGSGQRTQASV